MPFRQTKLTPEQLSDAERAIAGLKVGSLLGAVRFLNDNYTDPLKPIKLVDAVDKFNAERKSENLRRRR